MRSEQIQCGGALKTICAMATFPKRKAAMLKAVSQLSKQCDTVCVWLNEYGSTPEELLEYENVKTVLAGPDRNIRDAGKFAFLAEYRNCYYLTVDDDINYPNNYVSRITANIDRYGRRCIISYHGHVQAECCGRKYMAFYETLSTDHLANIRIGTGVAGFVPAGIGIQPLTDKELLQIDTDVSFSVWAMNSGIPMICCAHKKGWLTNICINDVKYDRVARLTGTQYLKEKRATEMKKLIARRKVNDPVREAQVLCRCMSIQQ